MGLITNVLAAMRVHTHNRNHHHLSHRFIDFIPQNGNRIILGGRRGEMRKGSYFMTYAEDLQLNVFTLACRETVQQGHGGVVLCSGSGNLFPSIDELNVSPDQLSVFGYTNSYSPLNSNNNSAESVYHFFERIIRSYGKRIGIREEVTTILIGTIQMLIDILYKAFGASYLTLDNLSQLASILERYDQIPFMNYVETNMGGFPSNWKNILTLRWDDIHREFFSFWYAMQEALRGMQPAGRQSESLYSALCKGKLCYFNLLPSAEMLTDIIFSELAFLRDRSIYYDFIDYHVPLKHVDEYRYLDNRSYCIIGDSLAKLNLSKANLQNPACLCLGMTAADAKELLEMMVASGAWIETNFGFTTHGSQVSFHTSDQKPIHENGLTYQQIPDGSAVLLAPNGIRRIDFIF